MLWSISMPFVGERLEQRVAIFLMAQLAQHRNGQHPASQFQQHILYKFIVIHISPCGRTILYIIQYVKSESIM